MGMKKQEALERGFEWQYYNPYLCRADLVAYTFLTFLIIFSTIFGFFKYTKLFLLILGSIAFALSMTLLVEILTAEKIEVRGRNKV